MTTPVYKEFPHFVPPTTGNTVTVTPAGTYSGIFDKIVIAKTLTGTVTIADKVGTIATFAIGTLAGSYPFETDYAAPLTVATTASDFITIMAGPV